MYSVTLNNGAIYPVDWCGESGGVLCVQVTDPGLSITAAAEAFGDPDATRHIVFDYHAGQVTHEGYTQLILVQDRRWQSGGLLLQLRKGGETA